jgi:hypothetical protein
MYDLGFVVRCCLWMFSLSEDNPEIPNYRLCTGRSLKRWRSLGFPRWMWGPASLIVSMCSQLYPKLTLQSLNCGFSFSIQCSWQNSFIKLYQNELNVEYRAQKDTEVSLALDSSMTGKKTEETQWEKSVITNGWLIRKNNNALINICEYLSTCTVVRFLMTYWLITLHILWWVHKMTQKFGSSMVGNVCNSSYLGGRGRRITVLGRRGNFEIARDPILKTN